MPNEKLTQLSDATLPAQPGDLLYIVQNVSTTPSSRRITFANLITITNAVTGFGVSGQPVLTGDVTLIQGVNVTLTQAGQNITIAASGNFVTGLNVSGQPVLTGDVVLIQGSNIALSQAGQNITIAGSMTDAIEFVIDGGGSVLTTGMKGYLEIPFAATITRATLLADQSGSVVVNIYKCTYAQFDAGSTHPVAADKITASAPPTISTATKAQDSTLTGWTTAISAGDILAFNVDSVTTIQRVTLSLKITE